MHAVDELNGEQLHEHSLDSNTVCYYLNVKADEIVVFQSTFEAYEGLATVRTAGKNPAVVAVIATCDMAPIVRELLFDLRAGAMDSSSFSGSFKIEWQNSAQVPESVNFSQ